MDIIPSVLLILTLLNLLTATPQPKPANIVLLIADDLGYGDVGCFGNTSLPTPNIDKIAANGVKLTHHLAAAAVCTPSRAAFLTSRYPIRSGMAPVGIMQVGLFLSSTNGLPGSEITIGELVKNSTYKTYATAFIGKWHLGVHGSNFRDYEHFPTSQGFDYYYGLPFSVVKDFDENCIKSARSRNPNLDIVCSTIILGGVISMLFLLRKCKNVGMCLVLLLLFLLMVGTGLVWWTVLNLKLLTGILMRNKVVIEQPVNIYTLTDRFVQESKSFLRQRSEDGQPFLLTVSFTQVHSAMHGTKFKGQSAYGPFGDEVMELDWSVGAIVQALDELELTNNTFLYFTSDNGGHLEEKGPNNVRYGGHNGMFKGGKIQGGMEGGIRIPTVAMFPGRIPAGSVVDTPTSQMDIFPTVAALTSSPLPDDKVLDGMNILPLLEGKQIHSPHEFLFHYCNSEIHSARYIPKDGSSDVWKVRFAQPNWNPGSFQCDYMCECMDSVTLHPPLVFNLQYDPAEDHPCTVQSPCNGDRQDYDAIISMVQRAVQQHKKSVIPVESQFTLLKILPRPWLQPCCNFPRCSCIESI